MKKKQIILWEAFPIKKLFSTHLSNIISQVFLIHLMKTNNKKQLKISKLSIFHQIFSQFQIAIFFIKEIFFLLKPKRRS
jgi:hypothetical protein